MITAARARWAMFAAAAGVAGLLAATGWLAPAHSRAAQAASCTVLQVETEHEEGPSALRRLELPSGTTQDLVQVRYWINAIGFAPDQDLVYGLADGTIDGRFRDGAHAIALRGRSEIADFGPVGRAGESRTRWSMVTGATAGAIAGDSWYLLGGDDLSIVDIRPGSPDYLKVVRRVELRPASLAKGMDDFDFDPADGLLYGVSVTHGAAAVVRVDPASGTVTTVPGLSFPHATAYGAVVIGPDGALYATANRIGDRSVTYRLPRDGSSPAAEIASGPALVTSDAAGCFGPPPPPRSSPPPTPPPTVTPPPSTITQPPTTVTETAPTTVPGPPTTITKTVTAPPPPPVTLPPVTLPPVTLPPVALPPPSPPGVVPPPVEQPPAVSPTPTPTPTPTTSPPRAAAPIHRATPTPTPVVAEGRKLTPTQVKRRWTVTTLLLIIGGGAVAFQIRRFR